MRSAALPLRYKTRPIKITMYLGLDNIIKLKFPTNVDRCTINVLNCLTKNLSLGELIHNYKLVRCNIERTETADILLSIYDLFYIANSFPY